MTGLLLVLLLVGLTLVSLLGDLGRLDLDRSRAVAAAARSRKLPGRRTAPTTDLVPRSHRRRKFLMSMKDYPPSQTPGSFNLEKIQKQIEAGAIGQ